MARRGPQSTDDATDRLPKAPLNKESMREMLAFASYVVPYRRRFFGGLATLFFSAACGLVFPLLLPH